MVELAQLVEASGIHKSFPMGGQPVIALAGVDLRVGSGDFLALTGPSGSGKSTLLHILGCLDRPTSGSYRLGGRDVSELTDRELSRVRREQIGFVFQTFNLIPDLDLLRNVELPSLYGEMPGEVARERALGAIDRVGLSHRIRHRPAELSGGEAQRAAIARALAIDPLLILADEPTGNLDTRTGEEILDLFEQLNDEGSTLVVVTHDPGVARRARTVLGMRDGRLSETEAAP